MSKKLLAAVFADPDDDSARLVYGDWLQERGDPRGEFITLQFRRPPTPEQEARELELVDQFGEEWQGKIGTITNWVEFEKGFLAKCGLRGVPDWAIGRVEWATVKHVGIVDAWEKSFWKLVSHDAMRSLVSVRVPDRVLGEGFIDRPTRIRELTVDGNVPIGRIERARAFEHLRVLAIRTESDRWPRLLLGDLMTRLDRFAFRVRGWELELTKGADAKLSMLSAKPGRTRTESAIATLASAIQSLPPDALTAAKIDIGDTKRAGISDLKRALARQERLSGVPEI